MQKNSVIALAIVMAGLLGACGKVPNGGQFSDAASVVAVVEPKADNVVDTKVSDTEGSKPGSSEEPKTNSGGIKIDPIPLVTDKPNGNGNGNGSEEKPGVEEKKLLTAAEIDAIRKQAQIDYLRYRAIFVPIELPSFTAQQVKDEFIAVAKVTNLPDSILKEAMDGFSTPINAESALKVREEARAKFKLNDISEREFEALERLVSIALAKAEEQTQLAVAEQAKAKEEQARAVAARIELERQTALAANETEKAKALQSELTAKIAEANQAKNAAEAATAAANAAVAESKKLQQVLEQRAAELAAAKAAVDAQAQAAALAAQKAQQECSGPNKYFIGSVNQCFDVRVVHRCYKPETGSHLFVIDPNECGANQYLYEGQVFRMFTNNGNRGDIAPFVRAHFNQNGALRHVLINVGEPANGAIRDATGSFGFWGANGGALSGSLQPLFRCYNSKNNIQQISTLSANCEGSGWIPQGVVGYVVPL